MFQPKFKSVPELKEFLRERGIQTSLYRKEQLINKGNNKITELRTILQRESQNS